MTLDAQDELVVIETDVAFLVTFGGDPDDWVAAFAKGGDFPARAWAERMAALYNVREFPDRYLWFRAQK
jgi:hypothetical protein